MVNQATVRRFWPNSDPIGKLVWIGTLPPAKVVGVLGDVKNQSLAEPSHLEIFLPYPELPSAMLDLTLRTAIDPRSRPGTPTYPAHLSRLNADPPVC